jgi:hypothetical protein
MATGSTPLYDFPFPVLTDPVNVHEDIQSLAEQIESVLPSIGLPTHTIEVTNNSGVSITKGDPVFISGYSSVTSKPQVSKSQANDIATFPVVGLAKTNIGNGTDAVVVLSGIFTDVNTSSFTVGAVLYVGATGGLTSTRPESGSGAIGVVAQSATAGVILVGSVKGNGTWGSMKAGLA